MSTTATKNATNRLKALDLALKIINNRAISKFDDNMANVEALSAIILNWAETGKSIIEQVQEIQAAAMNVAHQAPENSPVSVPKARQKRTVRL